MIWKFDPATVTRSWRVVGDQLLVRLTIVPILASTKDILLCVLDLRWICAAKMFKLNIFAAQIHGYEMKLDTAFIPLASSKQLCYRCEMCKHTKRYGAHMARQLIRLARPWLSILRREKYDYLLPLSSQYWGSGKMTWKSTLRNERVKAHVLTTALTAQNGMSMCAWRRWYKRACMLLRACCKSLDSTTPLTWILYSWNPNSPSQNTDALFFLTRFHIEILFVAMLYFLHQKSLFLFFSCSKLHCNTVFQANNAGSTTKTQESCNCVADQKQVDEENIAGGMSKNTVVLMYAADHGMKWREKSCYLST